MIDELDKSLQQLLVGEAAQGSELAKATFTFAAPTAAWQSGKQGLYLDVYMFRVQEDRDRRTNERRLTRNPDGTSLLVNAPVRLECSYVITAWNFAHQLGTEDRETQEHRVLGQVLYVLWRNNTLPKRYLTPTLTATQDIQLPIIAAESNELGGGDSDFWSGLGTYMRPAVTCKITMSLDLEQAVPGFLVTTLRTSVGEDLFLIGGTVSAGTRPIANAWVRLDGTSRLVATDADGQFQIDRIQPGNHTLTVRAVGFKDATRTVQVPQPDGEYDITLTPM